MTAAAAETVAHLHLHLYLHLLPYLNVTGMPTCICICICLRALILQRFAGSLRRLMLSIRADLIEGCELHTFNPQEPDPGPLKRVKRGKCRMLQLRAPMRVIGNDASCPAASCRCRCGAADCNRRAFTAGPAFVLQIYSSSGTGCGCDCDCDCDCCCCHVISRPRSLQIDAAISSQRGQRQMATN